MNPSQHPLLHMLSDDLSSKFLKEFARRLPTIYREAQSLSKEDSVEEAYRNYHYGQIRYVLVQSLFLFVARECGYHAKAVHCETNGFPIASCPIGRFYFTVHHSSSVDEQRVINSSLIRKQHSAINDEYFSPKLFGSGFDVANLDSAQEIYANIIHGCPIGTSDFSTHGFLRIKFPYIKTVNLKAKLFYAADYPYEMVVKLIEDREKAEEQPKKIINIATPKLKRSGNESLE